MEVIGVERVADLERLGVLRKACKELVVDLVVDVDTRASAAALSVVEAGRRDISIGARGRTDEQTY